MDANEIMTNEVTNEIADGIVNAVPTADSKGFGWFICGAVVGATVIVAGKKIVGFVKDRWNNRKMAEPVSNVDDDFFEDEEEANE